MASPQLENGYTTIANEILEVLMGIKINATQYKIMICLIRNTYGWNKKSGPLSVSYIAKATNLNDRQVRRELTALIDTKMVKVTKKQTATNPRELGINKNYEEWKDYKPRLGQGTKKTEGTTETPGPHGQERTTRTPQEKPKEGPTELSEEMNEWILKNYPGITKRLEAKKRREKVPKLIKKHGEEKFKKIFLHFVKEKKGEDPQFIGGEATIYNNFESIIERMEIAQKNNSQGESLSITQRDEIERLQGQIDLLEMDPTEENLKRIEEHKEKIRQIKESVKGG